MSDKKLSQLTLKETIVNTDYFPIFDSEASSDKNKAVEVSTLKTLLNSSYVLQILVDAYSVIGGNADNTPIAIAISTNSVLGRDSGNLAAIARGNLTETTSSVLTITTGTNAVLGSGTTIEVKAAGASQSGYLSSTDWNTFNEKEPAITTLGAAKGGTGVSNNASNTITFSGNYGVTITLTGTTSVTFPTTGTLAALGGSNTWTAANLFKSTDTGALSVQNASGTNYFIVNTDDGRVSILNTGSFYVSNSSGANYSYLSTQVVSASSVIKIASTKAGSGTQCRLGFLMATSECLTIATSENVGIGETAPDYKLDVNGSFGFTPGSSVAPVDNGDVVIEATNNTTLTFKLKGSDTTIRTATLTLS